MGGIVAWVKGIILIILFATFLELLLPNSAMQRFIKAILGLFIMLTVLNPVVNFLQRPWDARDAAITALTPQNVDRADVSTSLTEAQHRLALAEYKKELAKQIRVLVTAVDGVADARVAVEVAEEQPEPAYGRIKSIVVFVKPGITAKYGQVSQVVIGKQNGGTAEQLQGLDATMVQKIKHIINEYYHVREEVITVEKWSE